MSHKRTMNCGFASYFQSATRTDEAKVTVRSMGRLYYVNEILFEDRFPLLSQWCWDVEAIRFDFGVSIISWKGETIGNRTNGSLKRTKILWWSFGRNYRFDGEYKSQFGYCVRHGNQLEFEKKACYRVYTFHLQCSALQTAKGRCWTPDWSSRITDVKDGMRCVCKAMRTKTTLVGVNRAIYFLNSRWLLYSTNSIIFSTLGLRLITMI